MTCARRTIAVVGTLAILSDAGTVFAQQPAQTPAPPARNEVRIDTRSVTQGFSVVLVLADLQGSAAQDDVPPAARRALADMKDFLPYKSYKLLDAAWILGQGTTGTVTRLRGVEGQEYELHMAATSVLARPGQGVTRDQPTGAVNVRFTLSEATSDIEHVRMVEETLRANEAASRRAREIDRSAEMERLEGEIRAAQREKDQDRVKRLQGELAEARERSMRAQQTTPKPAAKRHGGTVIHTTFTMDVGETVVVGTSRLRDNSRALIALLTAVPVKGSRAPLEGR